MAEYVIVEAPMETREQLNFEPTFLATITKKFGETASSMRDRCVDLMTGTTPEQRARHQERLARMAKEARERREARDKERVEQRPNQLEQVDALLEQSQDEAALENQAKADEIIAEFPATSTVDPSKSTSDS